MSASLPSAREALEAAAADLTLERDSVEGDGDYEAGLRTGLTVAVDAVEQKAANLRAIEARAPARPRVLIPPGSST